MWRCGSMTCCHILCLSQVQQPRNLEHDVTHKSSLKTRQLGKMAKEFNSFTLAAIRNLDRWGVIQSWHFYNHH